MGNCQNFACIRGDEEEHERTGLENFIMKNDGQAADGGERGPSSNMNKYGRISSFKEDFNEIEK